MLPQMTISSFARATISIKKFLPRHRRRRQATSPFIAEGDPSFLRIRSCGTLLLERSSCERSSCSRQLVAVEAPCDTGYESFSAFLPYIVLCPSNSIPCLFVWLLVRTFTIDRRHSHSHAYIFTRVTHDMQFRKITSNFFLPTVFLIRIFSWRDWFLAKQHRVIMTYFAFALCQFMMSIGVESLFAYTHVRARAQVRYGSIWMFIQERVISNIQVNKAEQSVSCSKRWYESWYEML